MYYSKAVENDPMGCTNNCAKLSPFCLLLYSSPITLVYVSQLKVLFICDSYHMIITNTKEHKSWTPGFHGNYIMY